MLRDDEKKQIKEFYQQGKGSIQDYARIYRVSVDEILQLIGEEHLSQVTIPGDMIDPNEAGPGATLNYGQDVGVPYSTN
jgi:hypothetical protein